MMVGKKEHRYRPGVKGRSESGSRKLKGEILQPVGSWEG
jgi:hypothetical protein